MDNTDTTEVPTELREGAEDDVLSSGIAYDEDSANLVPDFQKSYEGQQELKEIADYVLELFEADWESQSKHRERVAEDIKMYSGWLKEKTFPFKGASTANVPIMLETLARLQTRLISEIFGDWVNVVGVSPVGPDDDDRATMMSRHINWQMREEIPDFPRQMDRAMLLFLLVGDVVFVSFYDARRKQNRHLALTPSEFVTPYGYGTTQPDLSDLPHYTWIRRLYRHELNAMRGLWENIDDVLKRRPPGFDGDLESLERRAIGDVEGEEEPTTPLTAPYEILQWEGWLMLPGQESERFCQVVVDYATKTVLSLRIHEEEDWRDRERHSREQIEYESYMDHLRVYGEATLEYERLMSGLANYEHGVDNPDAQLQGLAVLGERTPPTPPAKPQWMSDEQDAPRPVNRVPIYMFAHGVCMENLEGNLGFGVGRIEADYQRAASTCVQVFSDAASLANSWTILKTANIRLPENFSARPGKVHTALGVTGTELRDGIVEFKAQPANPQLLEMVQMFRQFGEAAAQAPGILSGDAGKSGEPFRGLNTRLEQATKQLGGMAKRFAIPLKQVYRNHAKLNALYMDELQVVYINNHDTQKFDSLTVGRELYQRDYAITFTSDMKFTSEAQRIAEADQLAQIVLAFEPLKANLRLQYDLVKEMLLARGKPQLVQTLGIAPSPPPVFGMPSPPPPGLPGTPMSSPPADTAQRGIEPQGPPPGSRPE